MQQTQETKETKEYPILRAMFVKETGHPNPEILYDSVRLIQTGLHNYEIVEDTIYAWESLNGCLYRNPGQTITCQYPATARFIYDRCRDISDCVHNGAIVKDITFCDE